MQAVCKYIFNAMGMDEGFFVLNRIDNLGRFDMSSKNTTNYLFKCLMLIFMHCDF